MAMLRTVKHTIPPRKDEFTQVFFSAAEVDASRCGDTVFVDAYDPKYKLIWSKLGMPPAEAAKLGRNLIRLANEALAEASNGA